MKINNIECKQVNPTDKQQVRQKKLYATIPLEWLHDLPGESVKAKLIAILWCYSGMNKGGWFPLSNVICEKYNISSSQKNRILSALQQSGHIELQKQPGKAPRIKLVKPPGWGGCR